VFNPLSKLNNPIYQKNKKKLEVNCLKEIQSIRFELKILFLPFSFSSDLISFLNKFCEQYLLNLFSEYKQFLENYCDVIFSTDDDENLRLVKKEVITVDIRSFVPSSTIQSIFVKGKQKDI
jgi:hypothetical protein